MEKCKEGYFHTVLIILFVVYIIMSVHGSNIVIESNKNLMKELEINTEIRKESIRKMDEYQIRQNLLIEILKGE